LGQLLKIRLQQTTKNGVRVIHMLRKLFLSSLIALMPVQSWAVLNMGFQHQEGNTQVVHTSEEVKSSAHPCHQESLANTSGDVGESSHAEKAGCNSCTLCMAFGLPFSLSSDLSRGDFGQRFLLSPRTFQSQDLATLSKPPIL
jgi:hypothetical protein